jgi:hypothetical protein
MYQRGRFAVAVAAIVSCVVFPSLVRDGEAQDDTVRVEGRVAWIAGQKMVVAPPGRLPVSVDLSEVDQGEYQALLSGDRVIVTGRPSCESNRLIATSIQRVEP